LCSPSVHFFSSLCTRVAVGEPPVFPPSPFPPSLQVFTWRFFPLFSPAQFPVSAQGLFFFPFFGTGNTPVLLFRCPFLWKPPYNLYTFPVFCPFMVFERFVLDVGSLNGSPSPFLSCARLVFPPKLKDRMDKISFSPVFSVGILPFLWSSYTAFDFADTSFRFSGISAFFFHTNMFAKLLYDDPKPPPFYPPSLPNRAALFPPNLHRVFF